MKGDYVFKGLSNSVDLMFHICSYFYASYVTVIVTVAGQLLQLLE